MKKLNVVLVLAAIIGLCACNGSQPKEVVTLMLTEEEQVINRQQNVFALDLMEEVCAAGEENVLLSPFSVGVVCSMVANGAKGNTLAEILNTIGAKNYNVDDLNAYYQTMLKALPNLDATTDMRIADAIWLDDECKANETFVQANKTYYFAAVESMDLNVPEAAKVVNDWASKNTKGLIKEVVTPEMFNEDLRAIIANALYFKGVWDQAFDGKATKKGDFTLADGQTIQVDMMHNYVECEYTWTEDGLTGATSGDAGKPTRMLRLPFKDKGFYMDFVLPGEGTEMASVSAGLLKKLEQTVLYGEANLQLPKFTLKYHRELKDDMRSLGMVDVFNPEASDLSGMTDRELFIQYLLHDTYIEVNEKGAEAAAVTTAMSYDNAAAPLHLEDFVIDRPFFFFIREAKYGTILFVGKIGNPAAK